MLTLQSGLPEDAIHLIKIWLNERTYYVRVKGGNSYIRIAKAGTVQGSLLDANNVFLNEIVRWVGVNDNWFQELLVQVQE